MKTFEMSVQSGRVQAHVEAEERLTAGQKSTMGLASIIGVVVLGVTYMAGLAGLIVCAVTGIIAGVMYDF